MTVRDRSIYHCHGKDKGKKVATYRSKRVARAIHAKMKRGKR